MAFEYLTGLLDSSLKVAEFRQNQKEKKSEVISLIRDALRSTKKHINDNRSGEFADEEFSDVESKELSDKWAKAAEAIRVFDERVARTFEDKSDYWINPVGFRREIQSQERRFDFKFRLDEVEKSLSEFERRF